MFHDRLRQALEVQADQRLGVVTGRGKAQDALLAEMRAVWAGEPRGTAGAIGPAPVQPGGPPLLIGGTGAAAIRRTTTLGAGWISGGGGPAMFADAAGRVRASSP